MAGHEFERENDVAKYIMVVSTNPTDGKEAEYNDWYDNIHIPDVCDVPGMVGGERWKAVPELCMSQPPRPYLAIYEIESDNPGTPGRRQHKPRTLRLMGTPAWLAR